MQVPELIVQPLEVVEVEHQHGEAAAPLMGEFVEPFEERAPIGDPGQRVDLREAAGGAFRSSPARPDSAREHTHRDRQENHRQDSAIDRRCVRVHRNQSPADQLSKLMGIDDFFYFLF